MDHRRGLGIGQGGETARHVFQHLDKDAAHAAKHHMAESRLIFRAYKQLSAANHLLHHHAASTFYLHHTFKLQSKMLLRADVQRHAADIALVYRTHHLSHHGVAYLRGKVDELLLVVAHLLGHHRYAGTLEELAHHLGLDKSIFLYLGYYLTNARYIHTEELYLGTSGTWSGDDTRERHSQSNLVAEIDMSFFKELCHLGTGSMQ